MEGKPAKAVRIERLAANRQGEIVLERSSGAKNHRGCGPRARSQAERDPAMDGDVRDRRHGGLQNASQVHVSGLSNGA